MAFHIRSIALCATALLTATACNIRWVDDPSLLEDDDDISFSDDDGGNVDDDDGLGGAGGAGGDDGAGGDEGLMCEWEGTGETADVCETMPTAPAYVGANVCGDETESIDGYAYLACKKGFEIFNGTQAEGYAECLAAIGPEDACSIDPLTSCTKDMYANACEMDDVAAWCADMGDYCVDFGDDWDVEACQFDLNPMNIDALETLVGCMNDAYYGTCGERYTSCLDELITL